MVWRMNQAEYFKQYYEENKNEINQKCRDYYNEQKAKVLKKQAEYRLFNWHKIKEKNLHYYDKVREKWAKERWDLRQKVLERLGNKCSRCGFDDWRTLQIDHVKNDGYIERKQLHWRKLYNLILSLPEDELKKNYQLLCANCNWIKKYEEASKPF